MIAWCAKCNDPQECDERGCTVCAVLREKAYAARNAARRGKPFKREPEDAPAHAARSRRRRARLAAQGKCINGLLHPAPRPGKRKCDRCIDVHRRTA